MTMQAIFLQDIPENRRIKKKKKFIPPLWDNRKGNSLILRGNCGNNWFNGVWENENVQILTYDDEQTYYIKSTNDMFF